MWAEAFATAMHIHNKVPTKALGGCTLNEAHYGTKPDISHLHMFSVPCTIVKPSELVKKLGDQLTMCFLLVTSMRGVAIRCGTRKDKWW